MKYPIHLVCNFFSAMLVSSAFFAIAQTDHEKHHPKTQTSGASSMASGGSLGDSGKGMPGGGDAKGGMMAGMGDMMKEMGNTPSKPLYPSLMQLPDLTPEKKREEIKQLANQQITQGNAMLNTGLRQLAGATRRQDIESINEANDQIQRGQILLESGLEGQRALAENEDPRVTALQWFNREMNLPSTSQADHAHGFLGLSWFHYMIMILFALFAAAVVWMYFHKMQRANALLTKLSGGVKEKISAPGGAAPDAAKASPKPEQGAKDSPPPKGEAAAKPEAAKPAAAGSDMPPSKPNAWSGTLLVAEIFEETPGVKTYRLVDPAGGRLPFNYLPGQFISLTVIPNGIPIKRSYTIASSPTHRDYCEITVKHEDHGGVSHYLHTEVHEGELLQLTAPSGIFTFVGTEADSIVLFAGGVGVTPLMSSIRYLTEHSWKKDIYFFFLCKTEKSVIFKEEIRYLEKRYPNLHVFIVISRPEEEPTDKYIFGHITKEVITKHVPDIASHRIHICGPEPMMDAVKQMLNELEVPKDHVKTELFDTNTPTPPPPTPEPEKPKAEPEKAETVPEPKEENNAEAPATPVPEENGKAPPETSANASGSVIVTFAQSNKTAFLTPEKSILEASEESGVNIDYQCRVGTCGICKTKLVSGLVTMAVEDALTEDDKAQNIILACQAVATEDVTVYA